MAMRKTACIDIRTRKDYRCSCASIRYCMTCTLGMVLLELGHQRSVNGLMGKYVMESGLDWTSGRFRTWIVQKEIPTLVPRISEIYANVVRACLKGLKPEEGRTSEETLFLKVANEIDQCRSIVVDGIPMHSLGLQASGPP